MMIYVDWPCTGVSPHSQDPSTWECVYTCMRPNPPRLTKHARSCKILQDLDSRVNEGHCMCCVQLECCRDCDTCCRSTYKALCTRTQNKTLPMQPYCATARPIPQPRSTSLVNTNEQSTASAVLQSPSNLAGLPSQVQAVWKEPTFTYC